MRYPWANTILLLILAVQLATGFGGLISGSEAFSWVLWLHGVVGYAAAILLYWKGAIIFNVFKQRWKLSSSRLGFIILTFLLIAILVTGWLWSYAGPTYLMGMSLIVLHGFLACGLIALLSWHTLAKWYIWRTPMARNRRAFIRLGSLSLAGLALRQLAEPVKAVTNLSGAQRRFTGSYEIGSFTGIFPTTSWLSDHPAPVNVETWRLEIEGAVHQPLSLTYEELNQLTSDTKIALLDCTGGFYTTQEWRGVSLSHLLEMAEVSPMARSVTIEAVSGYGRRFPLAFVEECLLATSVAGQVLNHGHGFPVRLIVPRRRGYDWVKWVSRIQLNETSHLWQPPVPLQ